MIQVLEVTEAQKDILADRCYNLNSHFNVVTDADGKFFISKEQRNRCEYSLNPDIHEWIHDLVEIPHNPVTIEL